MKINVTYSGKHELPQFETAQSAGMDTTTKPRIPGHRISRATKDLQKQMCVRCGLEPETILHRW